VRRRLEQLRVARAFEIADGYVAWLEDIGNNMTSLIGQLLQSR